MATKTRSSTLPEGIRILGKALVTLAAMIVIAGIWRLVYGPEPSGVDDVLHGFGAILIALAFYSTVNDIKRFPVAAAFGLAVAVLATYWAVGVYLLPKILSALPFMFGIICATFAVRWTRSSVHTT
ncbi:MAG TPA: hypothetical protein VJG64_02135 [Candidatus Paceibacterota bacterium]